MKAISPARLLAVSRTVVAAALALTACTAARAPRDAGSGAGGEHGHAGESADRLEICGPGATPGSRCAEATIALRELAPGARLGDVSVTDVAVAGDHIVVSVAAPNGATAGIEVVRLDRASPPPPARTATLAFYLRSDAPGRTTPAWQLEAVQSLAEMLGGGPPPPAWLGALDDPPRGGAR